MLRFAVALTLVFACSDSPGGGGGGTSRTVRQALPLPRSADLDVLVVMDSNPALQAHASDVTRAADALASTLGQLAGGLPNLHVGVINGDLGTLGSLDAQPGPPIGHCSGTGNSGNLGTAGASVTGTYLSDLRNSDGTRTKNYTGTLRDVLRAMMMNTGSCEFTQPLQAMKRALTNNVANAGFLRENAYLVVVFVSAVDDCSFATAAFLNGASADDASYCQMHYAELVGLLAFVETLRTTKPDPSQVALVGVTASELTRLHAFLGMYPGRSSEGRLDAADPAAVFAILPQLQKTILGAACWDPAPADLDDATPGIQPNCSAVLETGTTGIVLGACANGTPAPCYAIETDATLCPDTHAITRLDHFDDFRVAGTVTIECLADAP
jgi:hypothetical protein